MLDNLSVFLQQDTVDGCKIRESHTTKCSHGNETLMFVGIYRVIKSFQGFLGCLK